MSEDAKVGLLVSCFRFSSGYPTLRPGIQFQTRFCSCIGLPGIAPSIRSEFLDVFPPIPAIHFRFSLSSSGSASCVHRPQHWQRLGPPFAGRLPTGEPADVEAFASALNLTPFTVITKSFRRNQFCKKRNAKFFRCFKIFLKVNCEEAGAELSKKLRNFGHRINTTRVFRTAC